MGQTLDSPFEVCQCNVLSRAISNCQRLVLNCPPKSLNYARCASGKMLKARSLQEKCLCTAFFVRSFMPYLFSPASQESPARKPEVCFRTIIFISTNRRTKPVFGGKRTSRVPGGSPRRPIASCTEQCG